MDVPPRKLSVESNMLATRGLVFRALDVVLVCGRRRDQIV